MLNPGQTTLQNVRFLAQSKADMINSNFITVPEWDAILNESILELYDILIQKFGDEYALTNFVFPTVNSQETYPLPPDFYKMRGMDWRQSPGSDLNNITLYPYNFGERNRYTYPNLWVGGGPGACTPYYHFDGSSLMLRPVNLGGLELQLWYTPRLETVYENGQIILSQFLTVTGGGRSSLSIEITTPAGVAQTTGYSSVAFGTIPTNTQFVIGGTGTTNTGDIGTAQSLADTINDNQGPGRAAFSNGSGAGAYVSAQANGSQVTLTLIQGCTITWSSGYNTNQLFLVQPTTWSNIIDGVSGWEEYVAVDGAIKALQKEESDVSVVAAQKMSLMRRIEAAAENRDSGMPATVTNIRSAGGFGGGGWGGIGGY